MFATLTTKFDEQSKKPIGEIRMILNVDVHIRAMTSHDFYLMVKWLNNQKVLEFYEEPPSKLDEVICS